jgi:hypothetical protein
MSVQEARGTITRVGADGEAVFSECGRYRYNLFRRWQRVPELGEDPNLPERGLVLWVMLNPSTADETKLDSTLTRCADYSRSWGYDGMIVRNLFAYRTPEPAIMMAALAEGVDIVGPDNDTWLGNGDDVALTVVGWGAFEHAQQRAALVLPRLGSGTTCLGCNQGGSPKHPLYLSKALVPKPFSSYKPVGESVNG